MDDCGVKCPFYVKNNNKNRLTCEGINGADSNFTWNFTHKKALDQQMSIFCCDYYKNCEMYRMLIESNF